MTEDIKITVLMCVYNAEKYLTEAVNSVLKQTFHDFEFLIVDDGSNDGSAKLLSSFADPRIRIITNPQNLGLTKALNIGLRAAKGKYIARLDADDVAFPERLSKQVVILDKQADVGVVTCWRQWIDEAGQVINLDNVRYTSEDYFYLLHFRNCIIHSSVMFRKQMVLDADGYNENYLKAQDFELWNRLITQTKFVQIPEILVSQRQSASSISAQFGSAQQQTITEVVKTQLEKMLGKQLKPELIANFTSYELAEAKYLPETIVELETINDMITQAANDLAVKLQHQNLQQAMHVEMLRYAVAFKHMSTLSERWQLWMRLKHKLNNLQLIF